MGGELYQIASIVAAGKLAMQTGKPIVYTYAKYENSIRFVFLPRKAFFGTKKAAASNVSAWFAQLKSYGLQDIKMLCPTSVKGRRSLGFSNKSDGLILCFFKDGRVTFFTADWQFSTAKGQWDILYTEQDWENPPPGKPYFENNTRSFRKALSDIQDLANRIACESFVHFFNSAIRLLDGKDDYPDKIYGLELPQIPRQHLPIFTAAAIADVFGAMGSWNDEPPGMAQERGLFEEYEAFSDELLKNIRLAILYAVNEW